MITMEAGLRNVEAIISMASVSKWYRHISVEQLEVMATHGLIIHPMDPTYLTCGWHIKQGSHYKWPTAELLENHFNEKHRRMYGEWRCENASEPPKQEMEEILPEEKAFVDVTAPLQGVWADRGYVPVDVLALRPDASTRQRSSPNKMFKAQTHMAMPSGSMASSSSSFQTGASSVFTLWPGRAADAAPVLETPLWEWMVVYAAFEFLAPWCMEASANESVFEHCKKGLSFLEKLLHGLTYAIFTLPGVQPGHKLLVSLDASLSQWVNVA